MYDTVHFDVWYQLSIIEYRRVSLSPWAKGLFLVANKAREYSNLSRIIHDLCSFGEIEENK
jgi:hypothetical protein